MKKELEKVYNPVDFEDRIYKFWMDGGYFTAKRDPEKKPYTIAMPPPNITGQLHMGHSLYSLQDALTRYRRMQGYSALWLPGTDHASIATEAKIVEEMRGEGVTKEELGREKFLERAWKWNETYGGRIVGQLKKLGASCDWSRLRFTLDDGCNTAVNEVFVRLYDKGLIYRGERIINWCPKCLTSISDAEVEHEEKQGYFWHIRYPLEDGNGHIEIATTRPETMLGDTAVAVNPNDGRYKNLIGKSIVLPLVKRTIPIIADDYVDMEFGTGAVKITPAHDPNDFEVGLRHNLPVINVMDENARINENGGNYCGMERYEARKAIVRDLEENKSLIKIEEHIHNVGHCYRCSTVVEPWASKQWFVKMEPLAKPAVEAVKTKKTRFVPNRFENTYLHWMENIRDWCISRQLWWGHRIPAYYCMDCNEITVSKERVMSCPKCSSENIKQDEDTLDTWFSSALWPFSTLGWPEETEDFKYFYPTNTLLTAYDIIFFWVARMIFSGLEHTGEVPFDTVFIHGLVRDINGKKMSKSAGNGIDPLDIIEKYGADALRFALATGNSPGNDMRFGEEKVKSARNFINKLWNAARFILMNTEDNIKEEILPEKFKIEDKWLLHNYNILIKEVTENFDKFELGVAAGKLYDFTWDIFCDWYIELAKPRLALSESSVDVQKILIFVMSGILRLLHPFIPFVTEEIWRVLPHDSKSIMVAEWPVYKESFEFAEDNRNFGKLMNVIKNIRNLRLEMNVPPSKKVNIFIKADKEEIEIFRSGVVFLERLAGADRVEFASSFEIENASKIITESAEIFIPLDQLVDKNKEKERLIREKSICEKDIEFIESKLSNKGFMDKAPEKIIAQEKEKLALAKEKLDKILNSLK